MRTGRCRGYTLVEMLVVVIIMMILVAAALPVVRGVMEDGKNRAGALQLNGYLVMARSYAARNNRPSG
ncbi:MAG: prepilin-type N-terminal cleavage/methylation domain-containing protein, partial [Phycisphaeraceae bacterium]